MAFDVASTLYVNVEHDVLPVGSLPFNLRLQCSVEPVGIDLLVFKELAVGNLLSELLGREEEILDAVLFRSPWLSACARDGEREVQLLVLVHQPVDDGALSRS